MWGSSECLGPAGRCAGSAVGSLLLLQNSPSTFPGQVGCETLQFSAVSSWQVCMRVNKTLCGLRLQLSLIWHKKKETVHLFFIKTSFLAAFQHGWTASNRNSWPVCKTARNMPTVTDQTTSVGTSRWWWPLSVLTMNLRACGVKDSHFICYIEERREKKILCCTACNAGNFVSNRQVGMT